MIAYVDGGSRGNSGPAGVGVVIEHPCGTRVEISHPITAGDNNYAEYAALLVALEYAAACNSPRLQVFSDSEVVVRQISGSYNCQSPSLRDIHRTCKRLISRLEDFAITHIRRHNNEHANRLAREAVNRAARSQGAQAHDESLRLGNTLSGLAGPFAAPGPLAIEQAG